MTQHLHGAARERLLVEVRGWYADGLSIRGIAARTGYSYTATRQQLVAAGVELRPRFVPVALGTGVDPLQVACPRCEAVAGVRCLVPFGGRARRTHDVRLRALLRAVRDGA